METYDLVVGSGPAGEKAAALAAYFGKRVAVVERNGPPGWKLPLVVARLAAHPRSLRVVQCVPSRVRNTSVPGSPAVS